MQNIDVIILAAGKGTRMYSSIPKVLHEVGSKSLLNHVITTAQKIKPKKIHLVVSEEISKTYTNADKDINFVIQKKRKGTADAISQCIPYLRQNFLCNAGIFCLFTKDLKKYLPLISNKNKKKEFYATDIFKIAKNNNINVKPEIVSEGEVMGVNNKEDLATAEKALQTKLRQKFLKKGVTMVDPDTVYLSADTKCGKDVLIQP